MKQSKKVTIPVYDFLATPEREKQLAKEHPLTDPELRKDAAKVKNISADIRRNWT